MQTVTRRSALAAAMLTPVGLLRARSANAQESGVGDFGPAPEFTGISTWLNSPPLTMAQLRGKVVLIDFWTYSCINCQRSLPHVEAWYRRYAHDGFVVVGVHTPEFAFEHVVSNVVAAARQLGVHYPIAIDNTYGTWDAYQNNYWPAEYLIDATGELRHVAFGEGDYSGTETLIRNLLAAAHPGLRLPGPTDVPDRTPNEPLTSETYLGYDRLTGLSGEPVVENAPFDYVLP
jgi:thiol-disulfide isomerase/thioredoxin